MNVVASNRIGFVRWSSVGIAAAIGLVAGAGLDILTYEMARAGPSGDAWSFRGNGALVVPLGLGPALLAGGWTAVVLSLRGALAWRGLAVLAGSVGALLTAASVLVLVLFGNRAQSLSDLLTVPTIAWPLLAVALASLVPVRRAPPRITPLVAGFAATAYTIALVAGFAAMGAVLPPGS